MAEKDHLLKDEVVDFDIQDPDLDSLINFMSNSGGFETKNFFEAVDILKRMFQDKDCTRFISFIGALVSTGTRGIIKEMVKNQLFDCIVTTCGSLDHDVARTFKKYYKGDFRMDDGKLLDSGIHRLGNILVPVENYGEIIEEIVQPCLGELYSQGKTNLAGYEVLDFIGSKLDETSFLYWAHKNKIPVIVPGILDGAVGNQLWLYNQRHGDFRLDLFKDQSKISELIYDAKRSGAFMIGGGISKHHTLWWNQYRGGLDYAVYITTASEWDGSLSGALVNEAISWGKVASSARYTTIHGEATVLLPFIYSSVVRSK